MKKKYLFLPLLILSLAACSTSFDDSSGNTSIDSGTPTSTNTSEVTLSTVEVTTAPNKTTYTVGENFVKDGLVVTAVYSNGNRETVTNYTLSITDNYVFTDRDISTKRIFVEYGGITGYFDVTVNAAGPAQLSSIEIVTNPTKTVYTVGDAFSLAGIEVVGHYSNNTDVPITNYTSNYDGHTFSVDDVGDQTVTIECGGLTDTFSIHVNPSVSPTAEIVSIAVTNEPSKLSYEVDEVFTLTGIEVTAIYDDESEIVITTFTSTPTVGYTFVEGDINAHYDVTIAYQTYEAHFEIVVAAKHIKTVEEYCVEANEKLNGQGIENPFEAKRFLLEDQEYEDILFDYDGHYLGYDNVTNTIVVYEMNNSLRQVTYPTEYAGHSVTSFFTRDVSDYSNLNNALFMIGLETGNYSTVKLTSNITMTNGQAVSIPYSVPVEIDFNGKTLDADYCCNIVSINDADAVVSLKGGTIKTYENRTKVDTNKQSPTGITVFKADEVNIDNMTIQCDARYGYAVIDHLLSNADAKINIINSNIVAETTAICVQKVIFDVYKTDIDGIVNINGGNSTFNDCDITAQGHVDGDVTVMVENLDIYRHAELMFYNNSLTCDTYMISSSDAIIIFDRRSVKGTFESPTVLVKDCRLEAAYYGTTVCGYGIRYIDLQFDSSKSTPDPNNIAISGNTVFVKCSGASYEQAVGGYYRYTNTPLSE